MLTNIHSNGCRVVRSSVEPASRQRKERRNERTTSANCLNPTASATCPYCLGLLLNNDPHAFQSTLFSTPLQPNSCTRLDGSRKTTA